MAVINVDDIYILNETGAQVDKVTGLFTKDEETTSGEKAFAQLNVGASGGGGGGGRNLLDNPWFTVNQRGDTQITNAGYHLDRWYSYGGYTITANGLTVGTANLFDQYLESALKTALNGKTITMSAMNYDGTVYSATGTYNATPSGNITIGTNGLIRFIITGSGSPRFQPTGAFTLRAVKLELGSVSTLANDAPPDYAEELEKCQRYFQRVVAPSYGNGFGFGRAHSATECRVYIPLPVPLRASPTVSITNIGSVSLAGNGNTYACSAMAYSGRSESGVNLSFTTSGLTTNQLYLLYRSGSADVYIDLSADL